MTTPTPLRVLFYTDSSVVGGAENVARSLVASLGPGVEPIVAGTEPAVVDHIAAGRDATATRVLNKVAGRSDVRTIAAHAAALWELGADVVHVDRHLWSGQYGVLAAAWAGVPALCAVHGVLPASSTSQRVLSAATARLAQHYVGVSEYVSTEVRRQLHLPAGRVTTVRNGIPPTSAACGNGSAPGGAAREQADILCVGRLASEKGVDLLVRAMVALPGADAVVVGEGDERPRLEALARDLGVDRRVHFVGWVEGWTERYDPRVVVVPSRAEALGLVVLEAMQAGLAVVATRVGGVPEAVVDSVTGILVPPGDPVALADAIAAVRADDPRRQAMGEAGRAKVAGQFRRDAMVAAYEDLYSRLSRRPTPAGRARNLGQLVPPATRRRARHALGALVRRPVRPPTVADHVAAAHPGALRGRVLLVGTEPPAAHLGAAAHWERWERDPRRLDASVLADLSRRGSLGHARYDAVLADALAWAPHARQAVLDNLWEALRPGGTLLVVSTPGDAQTSGARPDAHHPVGPQAAAHALVVEGRLVVRREKDARRDGGARPVAGAVG